MTCLLKQQDCGLKAGDTQCGKCGLRPGEGFPTREDRDLATLKATALYWQNHAKELEEQSKSHARELAAAAEKAEMVVETETAKILHEKSNHSMLQKIWNCDFIERSFDAAWESVTKPASKIRAYMGGYIYL